MRKSPWPSVANALHSREPSPIALAGPIRTPTLNLANASYQRVAITHTYKLVHDLKNNGMTNKFLAWPVAAHNASDPVRQRERNRFWLEWMDTYLQPGKVAEAGKAGSN